MKLFRRGSLTADNSLELQGLGYHWYSETTAVCNCKDSALCRQILWVLESYGW